MAFVQVRSWDMVAAGAASGSRGLPVPVRRAAACAFTLLVHLMLLWLLLNHLSGGLPGAAAREQTLTIFNVAPPGDSNDEQPAGSRLSTIAPIAAAATEVDLSTPADLPKPEWTLASIRVPRTAPSSAALAGAAADQAGTGRGSASHLNQFVGFGDSIGGELLLDNAMLEAARLAALRAFPGAKGSALIFLRISPTGTVTSAVVKGGSRDIGFAFQRELVGKKLFLVRSAITDSALVALPPVSLRAS
jgi:hypothetical protein